MLNVFSADPSDITWITRLYLESAKEKHFDMDISDRKNIALIKRNIKSIIDNQSMIDFSLETQTLIFEKNKKRIGYVVMSAVTNQPSAVEIHLMVVDKKHRGKSYGRYMLNEIIKRWHPMADIHARCYPASQQMRNMLTKAGFSYRGTLADTASLHILQSSNTVSPHSFDITSVPITNAI